MFGADGQENIPHRDWLVAVDEAVKDVQAEMAKQGRANEFLGVKVRVLLSDSAAHADIRDRRSSILPFVSLHPKSLNGTWKTA